MDDFDDFDDGDFEEPLHLALPSSASQSSQALVPSVTSKTQASVPPPAGPPVASAHAAHDSSHECEQAHSESVFLWWLVFLTVLGLCLFWWSRLYVRRAQGRKRHSDRLRRLYGLSQ